ncbi:hypothetical protein Tco_0978773 [Tanacetum coccineum]|uniref:Uncharacterized protein n=1 Tax=Tanacetum coccineum TaxID=301880 RepID=A0ABQ5ENX5_9ASTR
MIEVSLGKGNGVLIEEIVEDDDVENKNEASMSKVTPLGEGSGTSIYGFSDSDSSDYPPWSSECMNEKRQQRWSDEFQFSKLLFEIDHEFDVDDPVVWQQDNYHGDNDEEEITHLFVELEQLLEHVDFLSVELRESVRKKDMEDESASVIVFFGRPNKRKRLNPAEKTDKGMEDKEMEANGLGLHVCPTRDHLEFPNGIRPFDMVMRFVYLDGDVNPNRSIYDIRAYTE